MRSKIIVKKSNLRGIINEEVKKIIIVITSNDTKSITSINGVWWGQETS